MSESTSESTIGKTFGRFARLVIVPSLLGSAFLIAAAASRTAQAAPLPDFKQVSFEQRLGAELPIEVAMSDEYGHSRHIRDYFQDRPVIVAFSYYRCPNLCTLVLNGLSEALKAMPLILGRDYEVISVSIDPSEKPPLALAKKRSYLARLGQTEGDPPQPGPGWHFLTGSESDIRKLADQAGFHYQRDPVSGEYAHPSGILIATPEGRISRYFFGIQYDARSLRKALEAARAGKQGAWIEKVLLYCFHYDPKLSRNGPLILTAIRASGVIGALAIILLLILLVRTERRKEASA